MIIFDWYTTGIWHHGICITTFFICCVLMDLHFPKFLVILSFKRSASKGMLLTCDITNNAKYMACHQILSLG